MEAGRNSDLHLGGVEAEKVRFTVSAALSPGTYIGIAEMSCTGYEVTTSAEDSTLSNILFGTQAGQLSVNNATIHASVPNLNAAFDGDKTSASSRYAVVDAAGAYSLDIVLNDTYALYDMIIYPYYDTNDASYDYARSDDTTVAVYADGAWITVTESFKLLKGATTVSLGGVKADKIRITFNNTQNTTRATIYEIECTGVVYRGDTLVEDTSSNILLNTTNDRLSVSGSTIHSNATVGNLEFGFDGKLDTRYAVNDTTLTTGAPATHSLEITLNGTYHLYTMRIYPFYDGNDTAAGYARSNDTTIEVYVNGVWITAKESFVLAAASYTEIELGGAKAEKIRINFCNTEGTTNATIWEITCTAEIPDSVDRSALLEAYIALESVTTDNLAEEQIKQAQLDEMKELLMNVEADRSEVASSVASVESAAADLETQLSTDNTTTAYGNFDSYNLLLSDEVGMNLYGTFLNAPEGSVVVVKNVDGTVDKIPLSELEADTEDATRQVLSFTVPAAYMTDTITVCVMFGDGTYTEERTTSVRNYAETILNDPQYEADNPGVNDLVIAMLNYGAYAQQYFDYNTDTLANAGYEYSESYTDTVAKNPVREGSVSGIAPAGWTLALESEVHIRFYFATDRIGDYEFKITYPDGSVAYTGAVSYVENVYRIEVPVDDASLLDSKYIITITETASGNSLNVTFSAMDYIDTILADSGSSDKLLDIVSAMKLYCKEADEYHGNIASTVLGGTDE